MSLNRWYNGNNKNHMETAEMERIMKTTIIGFPRVGSLRELKFASEKYFRNEITAQELVHHVIFLCENTRNHLHRFDIHGKIGNIYNLISHKP